MLTFNEMNKIKELAQARQNPSIEGGDRQKALSLAEEYW